jgi:hypothetical protein
MTENEFKDLVVVARARAIGGADERDVRRDLAARGLDSADLDRVVGAVDFAQAQKKIQDRRDGKYRLLGLIALILGGVVKDHVVDNHLELWPMGLFAAVLFTAGLWFLSKGERSLNWRGEGARANLPYWVGGWVVLVGGMMYGIWAMLENRIDTSAVAGCLALYVLGAWLMHYGEDVWKWWPGRNSHRGEQDS